MSTIKHPDWPTVATALAKRLTHGALHPVAMQRAWAEHRRETRRGGRPSRWSLAFSGGADSLALLLVFWAEGPGRWGRDFIVLHFNHRLRGRAADADERFCARVCRSLGLDFVTGRWQSARRGASEAEARSARMEFFRREMRRRKCRMLWLAHQQDDIAETMLMRLARGSGTSGLAAPRPVQETADGRLHLRPMLTLRKAFIVRALKEAGAVWREDATNSGARYFRSRIRASVLPAWAKAAGRDAVAGAAWSRELLEEDAAALDTWLDELKPMDRAGRLVLGRLAGRPQALWRRALHRWMLGQDVQTDLSRQGFAALLAGIQRGRPTRFSLGGGFAVVEGGKLLYERG
ncbi:MAG TPA: tRNA lysidine(34) synthetase TilS [Lacunisphaera sp.]|jgi:tRNA(Ile)-lysidine synthase|nr:tRNA lysidine(34) synthetase TilS [Lacunisphaera sp.]